MSLAGTTWLDETKCADTGKVSVLHIHGTADLTIDYDGAPNNLSLNGYLGAKDTAKRWAAKNNCVGDSRPGENLNISTVVPGKETETEFWLGWDRQTEVQLWTIKAGSHLPSLSSTFADLTLDFLFSHSKK